MIDKEILRNHEGLMRKVFKNIAHYISGLPIIGKVFRKILHRLLMQREKLASFSRRRFINRKHTFSGKVTHTCEAFLPFEHFKQNRKTSLRIACLVSMHMARGLEPDAVLVHLRKAEWKKQLDEFLIDFLLVESTLQPCCPNSLVPLSNGGISPEMKQLIQYCKDKKIPTVFWHTESSVHVDLYNSVAEIFDYIFAVSGDIQERYKADLNREVGYLPVAIQPVLHNPILPHRLRPTASRNIDVLFDGWADILEYTGFYTQLSKVLDKSLRVVESKWLFRANKLQDTPELVKKILGCISYEQLLTALRCSNIFLISTENTLKSPQTIVRQILEALACKCSVVLLGKLDDPLISGYVHHVIDIQDLRKTVEELLANKDKRERNAHLAWRNIHSKHTYGHRLETICQTLKIQSGWIEHPPVSVLTVTKRPEMIKHAADNYVRQAYPAKEWVIVLNSDQADKAKMQKQISQIPGIRIIQLASENNIGSCLNLGVDIASGLYWFKMDDDDLYGEHYLADLMLHQACVGADLFGKRPAYMFLESENKTVLRNPGSSSEITSTGLWPHPCGAAFAGRKDIISRVAFSESYRACVDSEFFSACLASGLRVLLADNYNMIIWRGAHKDGHTWRTSDDVLKIKATPVAEGVASDLVMI